MMTSDRHHRTARRRVPVSSAGRTWKQGVQVLRVDWPVYTRRVERSTVGKRAIDDGFRVYSLVLGRRQPIVAVALARDRA
jgi:hypothetical protein